VTQPVPLTTQQTGIPMEPQQPDESSNPKEPTTDQDFSAAIAQPAAAARAKPNWALKLPDNPVQALFAALLAVLLGLAFTLTNDRISRLDDRITRLEDKIDERFEAQDAKIDEVDQKLTAKIEEVDMNLTTLIAEINLKLTALIAALNASEGVDAALQGQPLDSPGNPDPTAT